MTNLKNEWNIELHHSDSTVSNIRAVETIALEQTDIDNGVEFDGSGRLTAFRVYATVSHVEGISFIATRGTARIARDLFGSILGYTVEDDFGETFVKATTKRNAADAFVSAIAHTLATGIYKSRIANGLAA